jgi:outer membrane protein assembly factor BamA
VTGRRGRVGLAVVAAAVGLLAAGLFPQEPLRLLFEGRLRARFGPGARLGHLHLVPGALRLAVDDLDVEGQAFAGSVRHLEASLSPRVLFGGSLAFREVAIDGARLELRPAEGKSSGAWTQPVTIERVAITNGAVTYKDPALGGAVVVQGLEAHGSVGSGSLDLSFGEGSWDGPEPRRVSRLAFRTRLRVSPLLDVEVERAELWAPSSKLLASGRLGRAGALAPRLEVQGHVDLAEVSRVAGLAPLAGSLALDGQVDDEHGIVRAHGSLQGTRLLAAGWPIEEIAASVVYDGARTGRTNLTVTSSTLGGRASGEAILEGRALEARARLDALDLGRASAHAGTTGVSGELSGELRLSGSVDRPLDARIDLEGRVVAASAAISIHAGATGTVRGLSADLSWELTADGVPLAAASSLPRLAAFTGTAAGTTRGTWPPDTEGTATIQTTLDAPGGPLSIPLQATFRSRGGTASFLADARPLGGTLHAEADLSGAVVNRLTLRAEDVDVAPLSQGARGRLRLSAEASGPWSALSGQGSIRLDALGWDRIDFGLATADVRATQGLARVVFALPEYNVNGEATLPVDQEARGSVALSETPLAPLLSFLSEKSPLEGSATGRIAFQVPLATPSLGHAQVEPLLLKGPGYALSTSGRLGLAPDSALEGRASLEADLSALPGPEAWTLAGRIRSELTFSGTRAAPRATGNATIADVSIESPALPPATIASGEIVLEGDTVTLAPTRVGVAEGSLTLAGSAPLALLLPRQLGWTPPGEGRIDVSWEGIQAGSFRTRLGESTKSLFTATLAGHAELSGDPLLADSIRGTATLTATAVQMQEFGLNLTPLELRIDGGRLSTVGVTAWTDRGSLQVGGTVDVPRRALDLSAYGQLDLKSLSPLVGTASLSGASDVSLTAKGTFDAPKLDGNIWVRDATIRLRDIPETLSALNGTLSLEGSTLRVEQAAGVLGGGEVRLSGGARLEGFAVADAHLDVTGRDISLRYPPGLRSRVEADLSLTGRSGAFQLAGKARVLRGVYDLATALQQNVKAPADVAPSPTLRAVGLDVAVAIDTPIVVRNKLASLEIGGSLAFRGDMETPLPFGRVEIRQGGRISVSGRDFTTSAGALSYEGTWYPEVSLRAERRIRDSDKLADHDVSLVFEGSLETAQPRFQAPGLSPSEAFSLVATGLTTNTTATTGAKVAGGAAASMLVGQMSGTLGLDPVTVQPELLSRETDPGTRFTFGKQITKALSLIYSIGLQGPEDRFLQLELRPWHSTSLKIQRTDDGTVTYGAGQRLSFGAAKKSKAAQQSDEVVVREVRLEGDRPLPEETLRKSLKSRSGKKTTPWAILEDADRLRRRLVQDNFIESEVSGSLEGDAASFRIRSGPRFKWSVTGMTDPPDLTAEVRKALFEEEALDRGRALILGRLRQRGHLRATVSGKASDEEGVRTLLFQATPGPRLEADLRFPGASALSEGSLRAAAGGPAEVLTSPESAAGRILEAYTRVHRFGVTLGVPGVDETAGHVTIRWPVSEGNAAVIASVRFEGCSRPESEIRRAAALSPGAPFTDADVSAAVERLRADYFTRGFPRSRVSATITRDPKGADVSFQVVEGSQVRVGRIEIAGLRHTRESVVRTRIPIEAGGPFDPRKLLATERRLMELGIFSRASATASEGDVADILVTVEENARVIASYDVRYNDTDKGTFLVDAETRNVGGVGLVLGGRYRVGRDVREALGSVFLPSVVKSGNLTGSIFRLEEDKAAIDPFTQQPFTNTIVQQGFQLQQKVPLSSHWDLLPGYRFKREYQTAFPDPINIAGLDTSLVRDTRDNPLDARRGRFLSLNLEYLPKALGSTVTFVKGFAQAFFTRPIGGPWSWAQGYRLGLARGFGGQDVLSSERFKAGGSNSLRGFPTDSLGPRDLLGEPIGGEAVVVVNEELRFRHPSRFGFALFAEGGNVFDTVSALSLSLRYDLGFGLRWESPIGLLRLDLGFPLRLEAGEKAYQLFFNFGQAF